IQDGFKISIATSLALVTVVQKILKDKAVHIKWPNDILAGNRKICGILIENIIKKQNIQHTIIGIGLNVNQTDFTEIPTASSLKKITGKSYNLEQLLMASTKQVEQEVYFSLNTPIKQLLHAYEARLFKKDKQAVFRRPNGEKKNGVICGITDTDQLKVAFDTKTEQIWTKEIQMIY